GRARPLFTGTCRPVSASRSSANVSATVVSSSPASRGSTTCPPRVKSVPSPPCHSFSEGTTCRSETSASCGGGGAAVAGTAATARPASSAGAASRVVSRRVCTGSLLLETRALPALRSDGVHPVERRRRRERCVRFALVPPCGRGDVLPQWPVALQALLGAGEPERLDRHP